MRGGDRLRVAGRVHVRPRRGADAGGPRIARRRGAGSFEQHRRSRRRERIRAEHGVGRRRRRGARRRRRDRRVRWRRWHRRHAPLAGLRRRRARGIPGRDGDGHRRVSGRVLRAQHQPWSGAGVPRGRQHEQQPDRCGLHSCQSMRRRLPPVPERRRGREQGEHGPLPDRCPRRRLLADAAEPQRQRQLVRRPDREQRGRLRRHRRRGPRRRVELRATEPLPQRGGVRQLAQAGDLALAVRQRRRTEAATISKPDPAKGGVLCCRN